MFMLSHVTVVTPGSISSDTFVMWGLNKLKRIVGIEDFT